MRTLATLTLALLFPVLAIAAEPTDAAVDALLKESHLPEAIAALTGSSAQYAKAQAAEAAKGQDLSDKQKKDLTEVTDAFSKKVQADMAYSKMQPIYAKVYKDTFSQEEIEALTAFFKTPAGAAYLQKMPQVQQKSQEANRAIMVPLMQQLQKDIVSVIEKK